jgi:hypothetical protein
MSKNFSQLPGALAVSDADIVPIMQAGVTKQAAASLLRTLSNTGVTAGTYGSASATPVFVVGADGRISSATNTTISHSLSALTAPTADFGFGGFKLTNLGTPTASADAASKGYVDAVAAGLDVKLSVNCASTTNIAAGLVGSVLTASANGVLTLDGISPAAGKRVLMKNQSTGAQNGLYTVTNAGSAGTPWVLTRTTDSDGSNLTSGAFTFVEQGTTLTGTGWVLVTPDPITVGTTALTFTQFNAASGALLTTGGTMTGTLTIKNLVETRTTNATASGNVALDLSLGTIWALTLTGNVTGFTISNPSNCTAFSVRIAQDGVGGRTVAWSFSGATVRWPSAITPTQTSTLSKADWYHFISSDGGTSFDAVQGSQNF